MGKGKQAIKRSILAVFAAFPLIATAPPERPAEVESYFTDGVYDSANFGWLKGSFENATPDEKAVYETVEAWLDRCWEMGRQKALADLAERGVTVSDPARLHLGALECALISSRPKTEHYADYESLVATLETTRPIFDALRAAAERASLIVADEDNLASRLESRVLQEQLLRNAFAWAWSDQPGYPALTDRQKPIFQALLSGETMRVDHENTQWLKGVVERQGWPTVSLVGEAASNDAWLLVQHADQDPVFQLDVLRLMEPLVETKEVSPRDFAYLYDRVMLPLTGKQRYATQMWCKDGRMEPQPLEDEGAVEDLRKQMLLEPFAEYRKNFPETCG